MTDEFRFSRHILRFKPDKFVELDLVGPFLPGELGMLVREFDARLVQSGCLFVLCRIREHAMPSWSTRQEVKDRPKKLPPHWIAYVGMPRELTVIAELIVRARSLLTKSTITQRHFQDEPSAKAWLAEMRANHLSRSATA